MAFGKLLQVNVAVIGTVSDTTLQTSASYNGVTFTFDRAMPVGSFATGEPFVVSNQPFSITAISPAASDIQGDGYFGNGAMKNASAGSSVQGFDGYLGDYPPKTTYQTLYDPITNVDPAVNGSLALASGEQASITKSVRDPGKTSNSNQFQTIEKYVTLTVLDTAPPADSYMPGTAGTTKRIRSRSDVDFTPRNIPLPASWPSAATIITEVPDDLAFYSGGERHRFMRVDNALGTTNDGYSAEIVDHYARFVYAVNASNVSESQRQQIVDRIVTFANQIEAALDQGADAFFGAGQGGGLWLWGMAAAALLRDDVLHQKFRGAAAPDRVCKWVSSTDIGAPAGGKSGVAAQTYFDEHLGLPWIEPDEVGSHHEARYSETAAHIVAWELLAVFAFNQGPAPYANGVEMLLNGGPNDATNQLAASLNFTQRWLTWNLNTTSQVGPSGSLIDAWQLLDGDFVNWVGKPEQYPAGQPGLAFDDVLFEAGAGQITFSEPSGMDYATEVITRRDFRYSLDGVQWVEVADVTLPHTTTGLLRGIPHWCSARRISASGAAPWSGTYPYAQPIESGSHRNRKTPVGAASDIAPSYSGGSAPAICKRLYPAWNYPLWEEAAAILSVDDVILAAGVGYPSAGHPAPSFTYQWQRSDNGVSGWSNIFGETDAEYARKAADAQKFLRCSVTATNTSGSVSEETNVVECPALSTRPAGTLIDTDFSGAFAVDYETEISTATASNFAISHQPTFALGGIASDLGALYFDKTGPNPTANVPLSQAAAPSTSYNLVAAIVLNGDAFSERGDFFFEIVEAGGAIIFSNSFDGAVLQASSDFDALWSISDSFVTSSIPDLIVRLRWANGTGGGSGGDMALSSLRIWAV